MVLLLSPFAVFANNNDLGVHYTSWDLDGCCTVDGFGVDYSGLAGDNNFLIDVTYDRIEESGVSLNYSIISLGYAFGHANEGAFSLGVARFDADGSETDVMIGYGRRGGEGVDYHIGLLNTEEDATFTVKIRGERGVTFSVLANDGDTITTIGYSWRLGQ